MATTRTFESNEADQIPDEELEAIRFEKITFNGIDVPVRRVEVAETYFVLEPPDASPVLYVGAGLSNREILAFVNRRLPDLARMREQMRKRFSKGTSSACRYDTGDVVRVLGRPFMLRVRPVGSGSRLKKASRGRATTSVAVDNEISLIELAVIQTGNYDQRRGAFYNWACGILRANAPRICAKVDERLAAEGCLATAGWTFRTRAMGDALVKLDAAHQTVWLSENLVPLAPVCLEYAYACKVVEECVDERGLSGEDAARVTRELVELGCPGWRDAREQELP